MPPTSVEVDAPTAGASRSLPRDDRVTERVLEERVRDVDEAVQRTWVLLFRNAARINDPQCLPGWLSTTASCWICATRRVTSTKR